MSHPQQAQLKKLCAKGETLAKAQVLLHAASMRTGPGTGYALRDGRGCLPAICAYIASEELGNADVSEKVAQTASCLAPKDFKAALNAVRAALASQTSNNVEESSAPLTYEDLIVEKGLGRKAFMAGCMRDVEKALVASRMLPKELQLPCDVTRIVVFGWTCERLLNIRGVRRAKLMQEFEIPRRDYEDIVDMLESSCQAIAQDINRRVAELVDTVKALRQASSATPSGTTSPTKSPTKPSLREAAASGTLASPTKASTQKRKVAFARLDVEMDELDLLDTPSKRQKMTTYASRSKIARDLASPASDRIPAPAFRPTIFPNARASSSRDTLGLLGGSVSSAGARQEREQPASENVDDERDQSEAAEDYSQVAPFPLIPASTADPRTPKRRRRDPQTIETPRSGTRGRTVRAPSPIPEPALHARSRRFRPVFLDQVQWFARDPKIEREWKMVDGRRGVTA
ncbi:uncharacterized protein LAESUDRAFT_808977 [Laetiporus sulphureus 93-53]|uniref:Uncharacterized protein n=1 Tax=Laetiporus sulphureus 93-53 TaxID=1314785 RepID=A0A165HRD6_9APHY|nr:uncharacterized protein LAESUDRAFT_808977 [Laetiporus sulphureus 93-53]KZT12080.1 hypothetical protein LAESUDRAFT_808977 [Laetiporus sulphureus 93-53]